MDNIQEQLGDWIKNVIQSTVSGLIEKQEIELNATTLNRKDVADMLGISTDSFDKYYRYSPDFPKELPGKRWSKLAIINYLKK